MKSYFQFLVFFLILISCKQKVEVKESSSPVGPYFSETADTTAKLFAEGIISKPYQELNSVFSPDGKEFYYTLADPGRSFYVIMMYSMDEDGHWEGPKVAPFSGKYPDADPYITSDNSKMYFISQRPVDQTGSEIKDFDIWMVNRTDTGWSDAIRLDTTINTPANEFYVSATDDGSIYYSGQYQGGYGYGDIYQAKPEGEKYVVTNLGEAINSKWGEGDPYVSPDGKILIFMSWGRADDMGSGDLYISFKKDGEWQPAQHLGPEVNSPYFEYCPMLSPDGKYFFWTSYKAEPLTNPQGYTYESYTNRLEGTMNGLGNIYWIDAEVLGRLKPAVK